MDAVDVGYADPHPLLVGALCRVEGLVDRAGDQAERRAAAQCLPASARVSERLRSTAVRRQLDETLRVVELDQARRAQHLRLRGQLRIVSRRRPLGDLLHHGQPRGGGAGRPHGVVQGEEAVRQEHRVTDLSGDFDRFLRGWAALCHGEQRVPSLAAQRSEQPHPVRGAARSRRDRLLEQGELRGVVTAGAHPMQS